MEDLISFVLIREFDLSKGLFYRKNAIFSNYIDNIYFLFIMKLNARLSKKVYGV